MRTLAKHSGMTADCCTGRGRATRAHLHIMLRSLPECFARVLICTAKFFFGCLEESGLIFDQPFFWPNAEQVSWLAGWLQYSLHAPAEAQLPSSAMGKGHWGRLVSENIFVKDIFAIWPTGRSIFRKLTVVVARRGIIAVSEFFDWILRLSKRRRGKRYCCYYKNNYCNNAFHRLLLSVKRILIGRLAICCVERVGIGWWRLRERIGVGGWNLLLRWFLILLLIAERVGVGGCCFLSCFSIR